MKRARKSGFTTEQSLGILFHNEYKFENAAADIESHGKFYKIWIFVIIFIFLEPDNCEWKKDDQLLFETAYTVHGKRFEKIREALPEKSTADLVDYYYRWKNDRKKLNNQRKKDDDPRSRFAKRCAQTKLSENEPAFPEKEICKS